MVGVGRSLQVALLEGLPVPDPVGLVDRHMVHVDRDPDIAGRVRDAVVDIVPDDEVVGLDVTVGQVIHARFLHGREIEAGITVLEIIAPDLDGTGEHALGTAVLADAEHGGRAARLVQLVQFDDRHLGLCGDIPDLGESDIRLADPARNGVGLHGPAQHLARLSGGKKAAQDIPAVLGQQAAVVELQFGILAADPDHTQGVVGSHQDLVAGRQRERLHEAVRPPVVIGLVALELLDFLRVGARGRETGGVAREAAGLAVHQVGLVPVLRGQEFQVEAGLALEGGRQRLVQVHVDPHRLADGGRDDAGIEVIIRETQADRDGTGFAVDLARGRGGDEVPLLRSRAQADGAALGGAHAVVDNLQAGVLLVVEAAREGVAVDQDVDALALEILQVIQLEVSGGRTGTGGQGQD